MWTISSGFGEAGLAFPLSGTINYHDRPWWTALIGYIIVIDVVGVVIPPLLTISVASLRLTVSNKPSAPPSGSSKCLRFGLRPTLHTLNIHLLTYLLNWLTTPIPVSHKQSVNQLRSAIRLAVRQAHGLSTHELNSPKMSDFINHRTNLKAYTLIPVSYTHLTLPTNREV